MGEARVLRDDGVHGDVLLLQESQEDSACHEHDRDACAGNREDRGGVISAQGDAPGVRGCCDYDACPCGNVRGDQNVLRRRVHCCRLDSSWQKSSYAETSSHVRSRT